jgi:hypothetical protein
MSLTTKYVSMKVMLGRILANPLMQGITEADVARYVADAIALIGAPMSYENKVEEIYIENYRAELPCDLLYIQQTRKVNKNRDNKVTSLDPMRYASDTFHSSYHEVGSPDFAESSINYDWTYSLNNGYIYTNFKEGYIQQSYKAIKTDEEGLPMIPDNVKFSRAIEEYIKTQWYRIQWELGKISDKVFQKAEQEYAWYVGGANTAAQLMSIDQAETFRGAFTRILSNSTAARKFFQDHGRQEFIKYGRI